MKFQEYTPKNEWPPERWLLVSGNPVFGCLTIEPRYDGSRQFEYCNYKPFGVYPLELVSGEEGQHTRLLEDCVFIAQGNHARRKTAPTPRKSPAINMKMFDGFLPDSERKDDLDFASVRPKSSDIFNSFLE